MAEDSPHKELVTALSSSFKTGKYHDLTIKCKDREWRVHRAIICGRSKFFEKACDGEWLEATSKTIDLPEDDPDNVERMLLYLYTSDYTGIVAPDESDHSSALLVDVHMYHVVDKYDILALKAKSKQKFKTKVANAQVWKEPGIVKVLHAVYENIPSQSHGLRFTLRAHMGAQAAALTRIMGVRNLVRAGGDFAVDLMKSLVDAMESDRLDRIKSGTQESAGPSA